MSLGNWKYTGDYYVSQKFGNDANDGSATSPFASLHKGLLEINNTGSSMKTLVVRSGLYEIDHAYTSVVGKIIGDGNVKVFGGGDSEFIMGNSTGVGIELDNVSVDAFQIARRLSANRSRLSRIPASTVIGARYSTFYDCALVSIIVGTSALPYHDCTYYHCNFLKTALRRSSNLPKFYNCYFGPESSLYRYAPNNEANEYYFENCAFHKDFKIENQTILEFYNDGNDG